MFCCTNAKTTLLASLNILPSSQLTNWSASGIVNSVQGNSLSHARNDYKMKRWNISDVALLLHVCDIWKAWTPWELPLVRACDLLLSHLIGFHKISQDYCCSSCFSHLCCKMSSFPNYHLCWMHSHGRTLMRYILFISITNVIFI